MKIFTSKTDLSIGLQRVTNCFPIGVERWMEVAVLRVSDSDKHSTPMAATVITDVTSGRQCYAKLNCISCRSMYFETERAFKPGNMIEIQFDKPPLKGASESYSAKVYWCMLLSEDEPIGKYGVGVKYR